MTDRDDIPRTTQAERERAQAVHSLPDETRVQAGGDETDLVQGAEGDLHRPAAGDQGGDISDDAPMAAEDERAEQDRAGGGRVDSLDAAVADLASEGWESA
jgi:hypothetical protein